MPKTWQFRVQLQASHGITIKTVNNSQRCMFFLDDFEGPNLPPALWRIPHFGHFGAASQSAYCVDFCVDFCGQKGAAEVNVGVPQSCACQIRLLFTRFGNMNTFGFRPKKHMVYQKLNLWFIECFFFPKNIAQDITGVYIMRFQVVWQVEIQNSSGVQRLWSPTSSRCWCSNRNEEGHLWPHAAGT